LPSNIALLLRVEFRKYGFNKNVDIKFSGTMRFWNNLNEVGSMSKGYDILRLGLPSISHQYTSH